MKRMTILAALALILAMVLCACQAPSAGEKPAVDKTDSVSQAEPEGTNAASDTGDAQKKPGKQIPVSQNEEVAAGPTADPKESEQRPAQSEKETQEDQVQTGNPSDRSGGNEKSDPTPDPGRSALPEPTKPANQTAPAGEQPSAPQSQPEQQPETPSQAPSQESPAATEPETPTVTDPAPTPEPVPEEPPAPKSIYDYEFDVDAIRSELIALGQSMGLTHITSDDGIACTPDNCSWASPITASQSLQGENLKRALQSYVSSMPSIVTAYGGGPLEYFTIYVRSNGGGSYTFYFLY